MGRLPILYAGKPIIDRIPYHMDGQLSVAAAQPALSFNLAQFEHTNDKPFEVHRMLYKVYALGSPITTQVPRTNLKLILPGRPVAPQPAFLEHAVRISVRQESRGGQKITRNQKHGSPSTQPGTLLAVVSKKNKRTWEWDEPFTMARGDILGVQADADTLTFAALSTNLTAFTTVVQAAYVNVCFQGFLVVVDRPVKRSKFSPAEPATAGFGRAQLKRK